MSDFTIIHVNPMTNLTCLSSSWLIDRSHIILTQSNRSTEMDFPVEAVIEMALAGYLDSEAIGFVDCKPNRGRE
jgi:hypothetical protein